MDDRRPTKPETAGTESDLWNTVVGFVPIPFASGRLDSEAFTRNCNYLVHRTWLDDRRRAAAIGGSSLIHHLDLDDQNALAAEMGRVAADHALVLSGIVPNPLGVARRLVEHQMRLPRPPDAFLLLPVAGTVNPTGVADTLLKFTDDLGRETGARFFVYLRNPAHRHALGRVTHEGEYVIGVKVGTVESDIEPLVRQVGDAGIVMWGVGDRATDAVAAGARGHTSGIAILFGRASDELNNAHRRGDLDAARRMEAIIAPFEAIRFRDGRAYNYSAVVAAARLAGFEDIDCGEGGPFNAPPPPEVVAELRGLLGGLEEYH